MEELLSLKWNNHRSTFIHVLGILRDKQLYTDATLACDGKFYSVHKLVLSTCSDYFSAMLDRTNCKNPVIVLKDIKCEDLEALLDYMYLGEVNVRQSDLATLIKAAECLRVKGLAVPDDEPPVAKKRETQPSRRNDTSSSPPAKRKRRSDVVDDGRDDVRPARADHRQSSPARSSSRPKSPASSSTPLSPVNHRSTPQKQQPSDPAVASSPKTSTCQPGEEGGASGEAVHSSDASNNQAYATSEQTEPFVKVEMDDGGSADLESYDLSNDGAFKEEDDGGGSTAGDGGDLSNDLPEFLQQAASGPMAGGAFGHSSFSGSSSFQPGDLAGWQGDGSNVGFPHLNFSSAESASQQNAPGGCNVWPSLASAVNPAVVAAVAAVSAPFSDALSRFSSGGLASSQSLQYVTCETCQKRFVGINRKYLLKRHKITHSGEKPFHCPYCSHRANIKQNLDMHIKRKHWDKLAGYTQSGPVDMSSNHLFIHGEESGSS